MDAWNWRIYAIFDDNLYMQICIKCNILSAYLNSN